MAHYILVTGTGDTESVTHVEADSMRDAVSKAKVEEATIYRVAGPPKRVKVRVEQVRKVEIE